MFEYCADPSALSGWPWLACYLTTPKHGAFYLSFLTVLGLLALAAPLSLGFGLAGAFARRASAVPLRWLGVGYTSMVRGVPDIVFFLFVPIAMDQGIEWVRHHIACPDWDQPIRRGNDFVVCAAAKTPSGGAAPWIHDAYGFSLALIAYAVVFGAFAANVIHGAMGAVPKGQLEAAQAVGMTPGQVMRRVHLPQMWLYALPGLSNLWMILIKATPLLFLLGVEDIVYWARELGGSKTQVFAYPHPDWRAWYFGGLLVFYLALTLVSERAFGALDARLSRGRATAGAAT